MSVIMTSQAFVPSAPDYLEDFDDDLDDDFDDDFFDDEDTAAVEKKED